MSNKTRMYPQFPIPAVGAVILQANRILLVQRGQPPAQGQWTLPGGVVELGEAPEEAIVREVQEECGLAVLVVDVIAVVNRVFRDERNAIRYHYVIIDYLTRCQADAPLSEAMLQPGTDVAAARWIPLPEVAHYDLTEGLLPIIRAGIALEAQWPPC